VAIVTAGSSPAGRAVARQLADRGYALILVYLDDQPRAEAAVEEILAAGGRVVAVRADLGDDLDIERLFDESIAAFGRVDLVVTQHAQERLRRGAHARAIPIKEASAVL
jgi:NAD(P)-dependent dehydrogenase (short-subunit alcohol dehydrogenase family)